MPLTNITEDLVPQFKVRINGSDLAPEATVDLIAVTVTEDIDAPGMFTLQLLNWDMEQLKMTWVDDVLFSEGNEVEINMGYVDNTETLMVGEITGLEPEYAAREIPRLTVRGYDRRHRLFRTRKTRSFKEMSDSDIATQIANEAQLTPQVEDTGVILDYVLQHNQTDMQFLHSRAQRIGYEIVVENKTFYFRSRKNTETKTITLVRESDLLEFYPRSSLLHQVDTMSVRGWDPKNKATIVADAGAGDENSTMEGSTSGPAALSNAFGSSAAVSVDRPVFTQAEADLVAFGGFNEMALTYITGDGLCLGRTDLRAGTVVEITGLGERFSGLYYVTTTRHSYSPSQGYLTAFTVRRNAA